MAKKRKIKETKLPKEFKPYFWDVDFDRLSLKKNITLVLGRLLNFGQVPAISWLFKNIRTDRIKKYLLALGDRQLDKRSNNFWRIYFGLPPSKKTNRLWPY